jgi:hypothetical protein
VLPQEPQRLEAPTFFPYACELCAGQKGPFIDTMVDRPSTGGNVRVMLCRSCCRGIGKFWGYLKGPEAERLEKAADTLEQAQSDQAELRERVQQLDEAVKERNAKLEVLNAELERLRGLDEQRRSLAAQVRDQAAELVGV